jgi:hypothetical protein
MSTPIKRGIKYSHYLIGGQRRFKALDRETNAAPRNCQILARRGLQRMRLEAGDLNETRCRPGEAITRKIRLLANENYPWRCLCRGLLQTTNTTPRRRTILQFSQTRLTLARTFMTRFQLAPLVGSG